MLEEWVWSAVVELVLQGWVWSAMVELVDSGAGHKLISADCSRAFNYVV